MSFPPLLKCPALSLLGFLALHGALLAGPIRFLPWDDAIAARKIGFQNAKGVAELQELHPHKRSAPADGTAGETALKLVALDRTSEDGKPVTVDIKLSAGIQSPLILILPDPKHPTGLRPFVIEDNATNFSWGSLRFINATGKALLVKQDKTIKALPETWTPVDLSPGGEARNTGVQLVARDDLNTILYSAVWEHHPDIRKLVFILPGTDARTGALEFKIIPEDRRVQAVAAAEEAKPNP
jgi:hypothetical protein